MIDGLDYKDFKIIEQQYTTSSQFIDLSADTLVKFLETYKFTRPLSQVHIHHTWIPNYSHFNGSNHQTLQASMRKYHIDAGYGDIAQHITIFPDGRILLGRDFNQIPASISNRNTGAFCIEQVGDFDKGKDTQTKEQKQALITVLKFLVNRLGLNIVYHNEYSTKTCPGSGFMSKEELMKQVKDDIAGHWAEKEINQFKKLGILNGFPDGTFRPDEPMTRAQFAAAMSKIMKYIADDIGKNFR